MRSRESQSEYYSSRTKRQRGKPRSARHRALAVELLESRRLLTLTHQYTFNDGTANDAIGTAHGALVHGAAINSGWLMLQNISINSSTGAVTSLASNATTAQHLQLPAGVLPSSGSATIEVWYTSSSATPAATRIFAFGDQVGGASNSSLSYTARSSSNDARVVLHPAGGSDRVAALSGGTFNGAPHMAAIVIDSAAAQLRLYVDSVLVTSTALSGAGMNSVSPLLAYLGRSLNDADPAYNGSIDELRIYDSAESAASIAAAYEQGPIRTAPTGPTRQMEYLSRGVTAVRASSSQVFVSWRLFAQDSPGIGFNVYRATNGGAAVKLNSAPLTAGTNYTDSTANASLPNSYFVRPVLNGLEQAASDTYTLAANTAVGPLIQIPLRNIGNYSITHMSVADLDGDGKYDYIVDRLPPSVNEVASLPEVIEAYKSDGTFLWSISCGPNSFDVDNIEPGAATIDTGNWDGVTAYDLDGDGFAEVLYRSANGVVFGDGKTLSIQGNPDTQFISVIDGRTGAEQARIQVPTDFIIDGPMAASFAIGYLDGIHPSLVAKMKNRVGDGNFNQMFVAYDYNGTSISQRWKYISAPVDSDNGHNIRIVDVDGDGKDEVADTAQVINDDGTLLYNMRNGTPSIGHGDRFYIGDFDPNRPGLEGYGIQQNNPNFMTEYYYDAATGQVLHSHYFTSINDNGRGIVGDIDPNYPGYEYWSFYGLWTSNTTTQGQPPSETKLNASAGVAPYPNFNVWWDGDVMSEGLNNTTIDNYNPSTQSSSRLETLYHFGSPTAAAREAPIFYGDIMGDWREEVIFENSDHLALDIYTTAIASSTRIYTLAQDPEYRNSMTTKGYLQSNMLDYYLGDGMTTPATPNIAILPSGQSAPTVVTKAAATPNPVALTTVGLSVLGADDGGESAIIYTWFATDAQGNVAAGVNFSVNGANAARNAVATFNAAGTYIFTVIIRDATGNSAQSNVTVTVNQTATTLSIAPVTATIGVDSNQQFVATTYDQFGAVLKSQPSVVWDVLSGGGTINATGVFTPPAPAGNATVRATGGSLSATANVHFSGTTPPAPTNLTATSVSASQIKLQWIDSVSGENGFVVESSTDGVNFTALATTAANTTSFNVTALNANATSYFRVRSLNANGAGLPTAIASTTTQLSPIARWKLDETSGTTVADATGNNYGATTRNGPTWTAGRFGNALNFDGTDDYVELPNNLQSTTAGSVSLWFKTGTNFSDVAMLFFMSADTFGNGFGSQPELHINFSSAEKLQFYIHGSPSGQFANDVTITSSASYNNNAWHNVVATWTAGGQAVLYVDGVSVGSAAFAPVVTFANTQRTFLSNTSINNRRYQGQMDDVQIFGTALTAAQVQALFTGNVAPTIVSQAIANSNPVASNATSLNILGNDDASAAGLTYTWSILGIPPAPVVYSANGTNAAKNTTATFSKAGVYNFVATMTDSGGLSTTSAVTVVVDQSLTSILLNPATANVNAGETVQFIATALDQFGDPLNVQPAINWSVGTGSSGAIDSAGGYTAPFANGTFQVTATSGAISGNASVSVALLKGDLNGDGKITGADIGSFLRALTDLAGYQSLHGLAPADLIAVADIDSDGRVSNSDIQSLLGLVASLEASGSGANASEPSAASPPDAPPAERQTVAPAQTPSFSPIAKTPTIRNTSENTAIFNPQRLTSLDSTKFRNVEPIKSPKEMFVLPSSQPSSIVSRDSLVPPSIKSASNKIVTGPIKPADSEIQVINRFGKGLRTTGPVFARDHFNSIGSLTDSSDATYAKILDDLLAIGSDDSSPHLSSAIVKSTDPRLLG